MEKKLNQEAGTRWWRGLLLFLAAFLAISCFREGKRLKQISELSRQKEEEFQSLLEKEKDLKERLNYVDSDDFIEREAREKLGLVKEGQVRIILPSPAETEKASSPSSPLPIWQQWWNAFFL